MNIITEHNPIQSNDADSISWYIILLKWNEDLTGHIEVASFGITFSNIQTISRDIESRCYYNPRSLFIFFWYTLKWIMEIVDLFITMDPTAKFVNLFASLGVHHLVKLFINIFVIFFLDYGFEFTHKKENKSIIA